jgi:cell envelope opacity-associated protein A
VIGDKLQAKIPIPKTGAGNPLPELKEGDKIKVVIKFLATTKIAIEIVNTTAPAV